LKGTQIESDGTAWRLQPIPEVLERSLLDVLNTRGEIHSEIPGKIGGKVAGEGLMQGLERLKLRLRDSIRPAEVKWNQSFRASARVLLQIEVRRGGSIQLLRWHGYERCTPYAIQFGTLVAEKIRKQMKKFAFPLQKAADWYRQTLSSEKAALGRIVGEIRDLDHLSESLDRRQREEQDQVQQTGVCLGRDLQSLAGYVGLIRNEMARLRPVRQRLESRAVEQRRRVLSCHRRVRLFEELEHRRREEWLREASKEEESLAAEMYLSSVNHPSNESYSEKSDA
jgi:hypothetical protein